MYSHCKQKLRVPQRRAEKGRRTQFIGTGSIQGSEKSNKGTKIPGKRKMRRPPQRETAQASRFRTARSGVRLFDHGSPASVAGHADVDPLRGIDLTDPASVVHGLQVGIHTVLERGHPELSSGGQEVQTEGHLKGPIGRNAADVPPVGLCGAPRPAARRQRHAARAARPRS